MRVSVIVAAYNEEHCIGDCLTTLIRQTHPDFEVTVVDDGSTDKTREIVQSYSVMLVQGEHRGPAVARNLGAEHASGEILSFLDADMTFDPDYLAKLVAPIEAGKEIGTFTKDEFVANNDNPWAVCWNINAGLPKGRRYPLDQPDEEPVFRAILKSVFDSVGGYDDIGYAEDRTISRKLGKNAIYAPGAVCYHSNPGSISEVYREARWYGKGDQVGKDALTILRYTLPFSLKNGVIRAYKHREWHYVPFKLIFDFGVLRGMLSRALSSKNHMK
ncbi:MAG: glycosyltransferase family 2 protein [Armatimonadota bacterium]|nr:glycosyltransferase family 2 protein [Armatimonadota bacterium]